MLIFEVLCLSLYHSGAMDCLRIHFEIYELAKDEYGIIIIIANPNARSGRGIFSGNIEGLIGMDGKINPNAKLGYSDGQYYYTPDDWTDGTISSQMRQEYNLSVSGGTDRLTIPRNITDR